MNEAKEPSSSHPSTPRENEDITTAASALARASAHEVNNALTAVRGYLDLARSRIERDHPSYETLVKADQAAEAAAAVVREFLSATRPDGELAPGGTLSRLITEARTLLRDHIQRPDSLSPTPARAPRSQPHVPEMVLVGEDDTFVRSILMSGLRAAGYEVRLGAEMEEIVDLCRQNRDRSIVMVIDLDLEHLGGLDGAREILRRCAGVPMILLSADPPPGDHAAARSGKTGGEASDGDHSRTQPFHWVRKPFPMANLLDLVEQCGLQSEGESSQGPNGNQESSDPRDPIHKPADPRDGR